MVGCLVEKRLTTPQQYPLTLNALTLACNQTSNRDPVVEYDEAAVEEAVTSAKTKGYASFVHPSHGRSALRYRHTLDERLGLDVRPLALLAVLMLRGPQTPGELRSRTERMAPFADVGEVQLELDALAARAEPLVVRLGRAPGQKEDRYAQLLGAGPPATPASPVPTSPGVAPPEPERVAAGDDGLRTELAELRLELERQRRAVDAIRADLEDLRSQLGG